MSATAAILRTVDLHTAYGTRQTLEAVDCAFHDRRVTAVVGPSGCGKTTLLKALNRTLELTPGARVTRGQILFQDRNIHAGDWDTLEVRQKIGLIHQRPVAFPMSIMENVLFGVRFHGHWENRRSDEAARQHLEQAGLWEEVRDRLREPATKLSGGQLQRLSIARILANRPDVILMDEPCSSLDPRATGQIEDLIVKLRDTLPIVIVTHNLSQARRVAQDAVVLFDGHLVESGDAQQVLSDPTNPHAQDFMQRRIP